MTEHPLHIRQRHCVIRRRYPINGITIAGIANDPLSEPLKARTVEDVARRIAAAQ